MFWSSACRTRPGHNREIPKRCEELLKPCCGSAPTQPACPQGSLQTEGRNGKIEYFLKYINEHNIYILAVY